jgi:hypothetical protein
MKSFREFNEGLLDRFKKKPTITRTDLTDQHRAMIAKTFDNHNAHLKQWNGEHLFKDAAHAIAGRAKFSFRAENGKLKASVAHHASRSDSSNPTSTPITHSDHEIESAEHLLQLKKKFE